MAMNIGPFLRQSRMSNGGKGAWSLRSVATRAGISDAYLSQLENGKVKQPLPGVLRALAGALHVAYEDLLVAAGYVSAEKKTPELMEIPVFRKRSAELSFNAKDEPDDSLYISRKFIAANNCFAIEIYGDTLSQIGIRDGDTIIIALDARVKSGDMILARIGKTFSIKKFFTLKQRSGGKDKTVLQNCNGNSDPVIISSAKDFELVGKLVRILKVM